MKDLIEAALLVGAGVCLANEKARVYVQNTLGTVFKSTLSTIAKNGNSGGANNEQQPTKSVEPIRTPFSGTIGTTSNQNSQQNP